jgi:hypothetical protein
MTTIDQRLLVPVAQAVVWDYLSNLSNNPSWQSDCRNISFLSSKHEGPGTRWRYATQRGRENVVEITAWYNGLGYEYVFIDGPRYRNNRGRIRLQEIAEGTIVQWTFTFEMGGMFSGSRSASRQIENTMASSLKALYKQVKAYATEGGFDAKSLMRDAPDVEARAQYKPRHPTTTQKSTADTETMVHPAAVPTGLDEPPVNDDDGQAFEAIALDEPPIAVDDTRPRPAVTGLVESVSESDVPPDIEGEPEFLADMSRFEPPRRVHDTQPHPKIEVDDQGEVVQPGVEQAAQPVVNSTTAQPEFPPIELDDADAESEVASTFATTTVSEPEQPKSTSPTTEVHIGASIWEVFGVERPSETGEMKAVAAEDSEPVVMSATSLANPSRQGLRIRLRRKLVQLRRPI